MEFSTRLKELRKEKGISQEKLAQQIHISRSAVAKWENGLGLPAPDSLHLLSEYFGISEQELLPDRENEHALVEKNQIISKQDTLIDILLAAAVGVGAILTIWLYVPIRRNLPPFLIGCMFVWLGLFNIRGNIASIHWYNRRRVSKENQPAYCRLIGSGTSLCGFAIIIGVVFPEADGVLFAILFVFSLVLMLFAQFKYNKGLF